MFSIYLTRLRSYFTESEEEKKKIRLMETLFIYIYLN